MQPFGQDLGKTGSPKLMDRPPVSELGVVEVEATLEEDEVTELA
jgi:hypothetical protein